MTSARNAQTVAIAGGGIGGLACALALARQGFRCLVLEQAREFGEVGVGLQVAPNALSVLDALGVGAAAKKNALLIERLLMMDAVTGEEVANIPCGDALRRALRQSLRGGASRRHPRRAARRLPGPRADQASHRLPRRGFRAGGIRRVDRAGRRQADRGRRADRRRRRLLECAKAHRQRRRSAAGRRGDLSRHDSRRRHAEGSAAPLPDILGRPRIGT